MEEQKDIPAVTVGGQLVYDASVSITKPSMCYIAINTSHVIQVAQVV